MATQTPASHAILFLNLGGPETQRDVRPFLFRLFSDPNIIQIRFSPLRKLVAAMIALARTKESREIYQKIGGGSPIRRLTEQQASAATSLLERSGLRAEVRTAFTCSPPLVEDVVRNLASQGVNKFLAFPLYPQFSIATTKGALERTRAAVKRFAPSAALVEIGSWPAHPLFIKAHAEMIRAHVRRFPDASDQNIHLVFSAHSVPEKYVTEQGDPYRAQVEKTVRGVLDAADWKGPWTLCWQSKLGPLKWLEPSTRETVQKLGRDGVKQLLVVPIAFVTDHVETLYELDQELQEEARASGIAEFKRVPGLNTYPLFIQALADLAAQQKEFWN